MDNRLRDNPMLLAYARASKAGDSQVLDLQRDALLFNEVDNTEHIPALPEGPRSSALDEIDGPHVLVSPEWAQAVELGRWPSQVRPYTRNRRHTLYQVC